MKIIQIIALCVGAAILYGLLLDQVTVRVCVEYFTIGHPPIFPTDSPTLLGIGWGIAATWWVGLLLGIPLSCAARAGSAPKRDARSLARSVVILLIVMAVSAISAGMLGFALGKLGVVSLAGPLSRLVPREKHARFIADLWAHSASYLVGFPGGIAIVARVGRARSRKAARE